VIVCNTFELRFLVLSRFAGKDLEFFLSAKSNRESGSGVIPADF
jgi:hypothetical protein